MEIRVTVPILKNRPGVLLFGPEVERFSEPIEIDQYFSVRFSQSGLENMIIGIRRRQYADWAWQQLSRLGEELTAEADSTALLCPVHLASHWESAGVIPYAYQLDTVRRVVHEMGGRAIFADEVGLGKTIEAGMILKEYLLRGLVRRA